MPKESFSSDLLPNPKIMVYWKQVKTWFVLDRRLLLSSALNACLDRNGFWNSLLVTGIQNLLY